MRGIIGSLFGSLFGRKATPAPEVLHPVAASPPREVHSQGSSSSSSSQSTNSSSCSEPQDAPDVVHEAQSGPTGPLIGPPAGDAIDGDAEEGAQVLLMLAGGDSPAAAGGKAWMSMVDMPPLRTPIMKDYFAGAAYTDVVPVKRTTGPASN